MGCLRAQELPLECPNSTIWRVLNSLQWVNSYVCLDLSPIRKLGKSLPGLRKEHYIWYWFCYLQWVVVKKKTMETNPMSEHFENFRVQLWSYWKRVGTCWLFKLQIPVWTVDTLCGMWHGWNCFTEYTPQRLPKFPRILLIVQTYLWSLQSFNYLNIYMHSIILPLRHIDIPLKFPLAFKSSF